MIPNKGPLQRAVFLLITGLSCAAAARAEVDKSPQPNNPAAETPRPGQPNTCELLSISEPQSKTAPIGSFIKDFEAAIKSGNTARFVALLHPAIIKDHSEKDAIFQNMMENYDFKGKNLQRRFLYELNLNGATQKVRCRQDEVTAVVGPREQWALEYSSSNAGEQSRLFVLIAKVPESLRKQSSSAAGGAPELGLVHVHTQNWSFAGQTPETLFATMRKWSTLDEPVTAWAFGTAARRIVRSNGYLYDTSFDASIADHDRLKPKFEVAIKPFLDKAPEGTALTVREFTTVFRESNLALGVKVETPQEMAVNQQIEECRKVTRTLLPLVGAAARSMVGLECLIYRKGEDTNGPPASGSIFTQFTDLVTSSK